MFEIEPTLYGRDRRCHERAATYIWIGVVQERMEMSSKVTALMFAPSMLVIPMPAFPAFKQLTF